MKNFKFFAALWIVLSGTAIFSQVPDISSLPDSINVTAVYGTTVSDSFYIGNTGDADLNYSLLDYIGVAIGMDMFHENDFSIFPGTDYTNSNWTSVSGGAQVTGNNITGVLTSPQFSTLDYDNIALRFDQYFYYQAGSSAMVEYNDGTGWTQVYYQNADSTTAHQNIDLPVGFTGQLRFTGYTTKVSENTASWFIDNIEVVGYNIWYSDCSWLTINSALEGIVAPSDSTLINFTCDATVLQPDRHVAIILITSNDPDEPQKKIPVYFDVIPATPSNVIIYEDGGILYINWDEAAGADSYDVYWSNYPYGPFTFIYNTPSNSFGFGPGWAKKFFYIVAKAYE